MKHDLNQIKENKTESNASSVVQEAKIHQGRNSYQIGFFLLLGLFIFLIGGLGGFFIFSKYSRSQNNSTTVDIPSITTSAEKEKSMAYEPTSMPEPTDKIEKSDTESIKQKIADKYNKSIEETNLTIDKNNGTHATGGVKFGEEIGGGWFLAAKKDGSWVIVDDGNGTISCEVIEPWDFPSDFVPECIDETGSIINR